MIFSGQRCMVRAGRSAGGLEAQARSELVDIKELGVRMFKQVGLGSKQEGSGVSVLHCEGRKQERGLASVGMQ